jgi:hypothetical protein
MRLQHRQPSTPPIGLLGLRGLAESFRHVQPVRQRLALHPDRLGGLHQVLVKHRLVALPGHCRGPAVEAGPLEQEVHQRPQAHPATGAADLRRLSRLAAHPSPPGHTRPREVHVQFHPRRIQLDDGLADQFAQARHRRPRLVARAGGVVPVPGLGHALDLEVAMESDVHLDAAGHAQAARPARRLVGLGQQVLQLRVVGVDHAPTDRKALPVHPRLLPRLHRRCSHSAGAPCHASSSSTLASSGRGLGSCSRTALRSAMPSTSPTWSSSAPRSYIRDIRVSRADCVHRPGMSALAEDLAVDLQQGTADVAVLALAAVRRDRIDLALRAQEQRAVRIQAAPVLGGAETVAGTEPLVEVGAERFVQTPVAEEQRPVPAVDRDIGAHPRLSPHTAVLQQVVAHRQARDFQRAQAGREGQVVERQGHAGAAWIGCARGAPRDRPRRA